MGNTGRILMIVGVILALYAVLRVVGLMASIMIRTVFPAAILIVALIIIYAGYKMKQNG